MIQTGKQQFEALRDAGLDFDAATRAAGLSRKYTIHIENLRNREAGRTINVNQPFHRDDALVAALVARGGFPRLSERPSRQGHVVCLPLIPFEARP